ncbi:OmpA family protein [Reichenbachiella sp. MALMAid0571]|uniref:OmpA family protein n=1 Tax=Reichenbachiella sp. MALMAid0571 TaxID=3143939 RepID=UPI0032DE7340
MIRIILVSIALIFLTKISFSQDLPLVGGKDTYNLLGDEKYEKELYVDAIDYFERALAYQPDNIGVLVKLGNSHKKLGQLEAAADYYEKALTSGRLKNPEFYIDYGDVLMSLGEKEKSEAMFLEAETLGGGEKVKNRIKSFEKYEDFFLDSLSYVVELMDFNSKKSEFAPAYFDEGIVFVSSRASKKPFQRVNRRSYDPYLDLYYINTGNNDSKVSQFNEREKNKFHEGPLVFFDDQKQSYQTRSSLENVKGIVRLEIYHTTYDSDHKVTSMTPLPFNSKKYSVGHPATDNTGGTLVFSSDMPDGYGGTDLYITHFKNGSWTSPKNLGDKINTNGNEQFPYIDENGRLYFSSDGHQGLGGLDIFHINLENPDRVLNPGFPLNSPSDDFGIIINQKEQFGYFSSDREGGLGEDDIYSFSIFRINIASRMIDQETGQAVMGDFSIIDVETGEEVPFERDGNLVIFKGLRSRHYRITAKPDQHNSIISEDINSDDYINTTDPVDLGFKRSELSRVVMVSARMLHEKSGRPFIGKLEITETSTGEEVSFERTEKGDSLFIPALTKRNYLITGEEEGYEPISVPFSTNAIAMGVDTFLIDLKFKSIPKQRMKPEKVQLISINNGAIRDNYLFVNGLWHEIEGNIDEFIKGKGFILDGRTEIFTPKFNFDKSELNPEGKQQLDKLVKDLISDNRPAVRLELSGHTDSRGDEVYNLNLSKKRVNSTASYLIKKGYPSDKITVNYFGEKKLLNACQDKIKCTDEDHAKNRRVEVKLL